MPVSRRHLALAGATLLCSAALRAIPAFAAVTGDFADVEAAIEAFRKAMLANDREKLEALCAEKLTYGHSTAKVQTKKEFIDDATSGKTTWKSITLTDESTQLVGTNATARFVFTGANESDGKTNAVKIGVLMVWVKEQGKWRLLARQGYKLPQP